MNINAIILARGGSKGIKNKNIISFCRFPLIFWTINQCLKTSAIDDVWVSSDSKEILNLSKKYGAKTLLRPKELSLDTSSSEEAWIHAINYIEKKTNKTLDYIVAPQITSPLREPNDFSKAIKSIIKFEADSLLSVCKIKDFFIWQKVNKKLQSVNYNFNDRKPRQQIKSKYLENGSFYIFKPEIIKKFKNRLGGTIIKFEMARHKMFQIDEHEDITFCEKLMISYNLDKL